MRRKCWFKHDWVIKKLQHGTACTRLLRECKKCGACNGTQFIDGIWTLDEMPDDSIYGRKEQLNEQ